MAAERPGAVDDFGLAVEDRLQQRRDLFRRVFQIGVTHDHVVAGRQLGALADGGTLALVAWPSRGSRIRRLDCPLRVKSPSTVGAAVIDDDQFDSTG